MRRKQEPPRPETSRTCVGCRGVAGKQELIRLVRLPGGGAGVDPAGRAEGRGAYLHRDAGCVAAARQRRALERALKTPIQGELWSELETMIAGLG